MTFLNPFMVLSTIGKKLMTAPSAILDPRPQPEKQHGQRIENNQRNCEERRKKRLEYLRGIAGPTDEETDKNAAHETYGIGSADLG